MRCSLRPAKGASLNSATRAITMSDREASILAEEATAPADDAVPESSTNDAAKSKGKGKGAKGAGKASNGASNGTVTGPVFPLTRVSRIVKADTDVETTSKDAIWTIAMATEYFVKHITDSTLANARLDKKRTLTYKELANAVESHPEFFFLTEVVPQPIALEEALRQRRELDANIRARQVGLAVDDIEDSEEDVEEEENAEEVEAGATVSAKATKGKKTLASANAAPGTESADALGETADGSEKAASSSTRGPKKQRVPGTTKSGAPQDPIAWAESRPLKANGQPRLKPGPKPKAKGVTADGAAEPNQATGAKKTKGGPKSANATQEGDQGTHPPDEAGIHDDEEMADVDQSAKAASAQVEGDADMSDADELVV